MIPVTRLADADIHRFLDRAAEVPAAVRTTVAEIIGDVRDRGDDALREATARLDGVDLEDPWLDPEGWRRLAAACPDEIQAAIRGNLERIEAFHARQLRSEDRSEETPGLVLGRRPVAYERAACYVPGGRASYPSTVLMTVTPARLAGVTEIIVATPPRPDGSIDPAVAFAAKAAGAQRILRAGGAQAVAALALGTDSVPKVDAIVGPGNAFVTAAKQALQDVVRVDAPAGPSELLVLADGSADPRLVALDMIAQAEHAPDAQVLLVSTDTATAEAVADELRKRVPGASRSDIVAASLRDHGAILVADRDAAIAFCNDYAPEHLEIVTADPQADLARIRNAGSVFLGPWTPVSLGDYGSGTNHVLPTMGFARRSGGLALDHFRKWITWQEATPEGLRAVASDITTLAHAESLHGHAAAVEERL